MTQLHSHRPVRWVMLVCESADRRAESEQLLRSAGFAVELIERVHSMVINATYRHYDAIVIDLEGSDDAMTGVVETRRIEGNRGQPPTPILGIGEVDGMARAMAMQAGFTEVVAPSKVGQELVSRIADATAPALPAA